MIPNRFHFVFGLKPQSHPFHLIHYLCLASCLGVNAPEAVYLYYHYEPHGRYWDLIRDRLIPIQIPSVTFIDRFRYTDGSVARYRYAHAADFVRLEKLLGHGGIYADMDTLFVNPIPRALYDKSFVIGREDHVYDTHTRQWRPSLCNAFLMAERNAPFGTLWLNQFQSAFDGTWSNHSTLLPHTLAEQHPDLVHIEPPRTFYKHMWTRAGLHTLLEGLDLDNAGVVSFHLWAHLWWSRWRRDFSAVHGAQITEAHVRNVDTTYNVVARPFLPPPETRSFRQIQSSKLARRLRPVQAAAREVGTRIYVLSKLVVFTLLKDDLFPRAAEHLDYAKRQWKHPEVRTHFHARNRFEQQSIFDDVALWDTYEVERAHFKPEDVILDIGAHVGLLSYLCHQHGSRAVYAFEPEIKNFRQLAAHLGGLDGVHLSNLAVFRSDKSIAALVHSGHLGENSGGGNVLLQGMLLEIYAQTLDAQTAVPQTVQVIALDEILARVGRVKLLKLDCEGSEFPILLTSLLLGQVEEIVGEYHEISANVFLALDPQAKVDGYTAYALKDLQRTLKAQGFDVHAHELAPYIGQFRAVRRP